MRFCCGRCSAALTTMSLNAGSYDMRFLGFPLGEGGAFGRMLASRACGIDGRGFLYFFRFSTTRFDESAESMGPIFGYKYGSISGSSYINFIYKLCIKGNFKGHSGTQIGPGVIRSFWRRDSVGFLGGRGFSAFSE